MRLRRPVAWYPLALALFAPLSLAARNAGELASISDLGRPVLFSLMAAAAAWLLGSLITRDQHRRAFVAALLVLFFSFYASIHRQTGTLPIPTSAARHEVVFLVGCLFVAMIGVALEQGRRDFRGATRFLNLAAALLLAFQLAPLRRVGAQNAGLARRDAAAARGVARESAASLPSIYWIVLDKYTGAEQLARVYGHDNRPFEESLRRRGFIVPPQARSNYNQTFLSLASMLNWRYLDDMPPDVVADNPGMAIAWALIRDNRTWQFLEPRGYRFVFFPTSFPATRDNPQADLQLPHPDQTIKEFEDVWRRETAIVALRRYYCLVADCRYRRLREGPAPRFPYTPESTGLLRWKFEQLGQLADSAGPVFAFAHLTVPHEPYIFNADCTAREPYWPVADSGREEPAVRAAYIAQLRCVNRLVDELVTRLIERSDVPPVIILQSDHGHGRLGRDQPPLGAAPLDRVAERMDIFAAYYLPGTPAARVPDSITPVNVFPTVMRRYFGADIQPLPDASFWSSARHPYRFTQLPPALFATTADTAALRAQLRAAAPTLALDHP